jgi:hypothetical protein
MSRERERERECEHLGAPRERLGALRDRERLEARATTAGEGERGREHLGALREGLGERERERLAGGGGGGAGRALMACNKRLRSPTAVTPMSLRSPSVSDGRMSSAM